MEIKKKLDIEDLAIVAGLALVPIIMLIIAIESNHSSTFYTWLRIIVSFGAMAYMAISSGKENELYKVVFLILMILYNPFIPIYLSRDIWVFIDVLAIVAFALYLKKYLIEKIKSYKNN